MKQIRRLLRAVTLPGLVFVGLIVLSGAPWAVDPWNDVKSFAPAASLSLAALLALKFNATRICFALSLWPLSQLLTGTIEISITSLPIAARTAVAWTILVPVVLLAISLLRERGLVTFHGALRILVLIAMPACLVMEPLIESRLWTLLLDSAFLPSHVTDLLSGPDAAIAAFGCAWLVLLARASHTGSVIDGALLVILATLAVRMGLVGVDVSFDILITACSVATAAAVVQHSYRLAYEDALTGLPGRRALEEYFPRLGGTYAIAMLDVDFFKKFNDTYGHEVGDQVLRFLSSHLKKVNSGARAFRYGGEEFTLVFPRSSADDVLSDLEQLRANIETSRLTLRSPDRPDNKPAILPTSLGKRKKVSVTVSIGVSDRDSEASTPQRVLEAADDALYKAKNKGRNQVYAA